MCKPAHVLTTQGIPASLVCLNLLAMLLCLQYLAVDDVALSVAIKLRHTLALRMLSWPSERKNHNYQEDVLRNVYGGERWGDDNLARNRTLAGTWCLVFVAMVWILCSTRITACGLGPSLAGTWLAICT